MAFVDAVAVSCFRRWGWHGLAPMLAHIFFVYFFFWPRSGPSAIRWDVNVGVFVCVFVMNDCSSETGGKSHSGLIVLKTQLEAAP